MSPKFKEGDKVFILPELETYLEEPARYSQSPAPLPYTVDRVEITPKHTAIWYKLDRDWIVNQEDLVRLYESASILQDIVQREQARFMSELEARVTEILRQTIPEGHL